MTPTIKSVLTLIALVLSLWSRAVVGEIVPVVAADNPVDSLSRYELVDIFFGKTRHLPDGSRVIPIDQAEDSPARETFYSAFAGKSPAQVKGYWSKMIFTGRGRPPATVADDRAVLQWIAENPLAIGYIDRSLADGSVKILHIE